MRRLAILLVRAYQVGIGPWLPSGCRFHPSCSQYALEAIDRHGFLRGTWLTACRLARCHPFTPAGYDPVP